MCKASTQYPYVWLDETILKPPTIEFIVSGYLQLGRKTYLRKTLGHWFPAGRAGPGIEPRHSTVQYLQSALHRTSQGQRAILYLRDDAWHYLEADILEISGRRENRRDPGQHRNSGGAFHSKQDGSAENSLLWV